MTVSIIILLFATVAILSRAGLRRSARTLFVLTAVPTLATGYAADWIVATCSNWTSWDWRRSPTVRIPVAREPQV